MNLYLSDGKAKVWRKKWNCKRSQAYSLICKAWWRCCHGMGIIGYPIMVKCLNIGKNIGKPIYQSISNTKPSFLPIFKKMSPDSWGSASYCIRTMTQNSKHPVKECIKAMKWKVLHCPSQSLDLNSIEHELPQLKGRVKAETPQNKHQLELAELKAGKVF